MKKILTFLAFLTLFLLNPTPLEAQVGEGIPTTTMTPPKGWVFEYDKDKNAVIQKPEPSTRKGIFKDIIYSNPEKLSGGLIKKVLGATTHTSPNVKYTIQELSGEQGLLAFESNDYKGVFLVIVPNLTSLDESKTLGLFYKVGDKDKYFFHWLYVAVENNDDIDADEMTLKHISPEEERTEIKNAPDALKYLVYSMNGARSSALVFNIVGNNYGYNQKVANLFGQDKISGINLCGNATLDFNESKYWDFLSDHDKLLAPKDKISWPNNFLVAGLKRNTYNLKVPIFIQYVFSNGVYLNVKSNKIPNGYVEIEMNDQGKWSVNLDGLPTGKYKLYSEFFLKKDGEFSRPDVPTAGSYRDYIASMAQLDDSIEVFTNDVLEVEISKDASGKFIANSQALTNCSYSLDLKPKGFWDAGRLNATPLSNCDKIEEGNSFMMLIKKAICATLEVFKAWADAFVTWAIGWMKASMGVTDSTQDMTTPDLDPGTGNVLTDGSSTSSGSSSTGNTSSASSVTTPINFTNDSSVKINSSDAAKIKTEAEKNSGVIIAKIFETDSSGKINATKGMAAQIKIMSPGKDTTEVEVKAQNELTYANSLLMFSADGKNYKISIINDGTGLKFKPAEITAMSGTIPELPGSASDSSSDLQNGSSSESSSTNNFRVLGFVKPSKNIADPKDYQKRYTEFKKDYQENINKITIQYGTNNEGSDKDDGPYKGAISVYDWKDNEHIFKFKVIGKTKLENVKETAYIKIGNGSKIFFTIKPRKKSINSDEYKTYFFK